MRKFITVLGFLLTLLPLSAFAADFNLYYSNNVQGEIEPCG